MRFLKWLWAQRKGLVIDLAKQTITFTAPIERTGAERDKCSTCGRERKRHSQMTHHFKEEHI